MCTQFANIHTSRYLNLCGSKDARQKIFPDVFEFAAVFFSTHFMYFGIIPSIPETFPIVQIFPCRSFVTAKSCV